MMSLLARASGVALKVFDATAKKDNLPTLVRKAARTAANATGIVRAYAKSPDGTVAQVVKAKIAQLFDSESIEFGKIQVAAEYILKRTGGRTPEVILTLGSGLGDLAAQIEDAVVIPYEEIPGFPHPSNEVEGHAGELIIGTLGGKTVAAMGGRFHLYQGVTPQEAVRPVRTLIHLGAKAFIVTNAAGAVNQKFKVGDFMLIKDHFLIPSSKNPLVGDNLDEFGPRFPDMTTPYSKRLRELARIVAGKQNIRERIREGVYALNLGPTYETPQEIIRLRAQGVDAIGMSTVIEVIAANHTNADRTKEQGPRVEILGISLMTNPAAGSKEAATLSHDDVKEAADAAKPFFQPFIAEIVSQL